LIATTCLEKPKRFKWNLICFYIACCILTIRFGKLVSAVLRKAAQRLLSLGNPF